MLRLDRFEASSQKSKPIPKNRVNFINGYILVGFSVDSNSEYKVFDMKTSFELSNIMIKIKSEHFDIRMNEKFNIDVLYIKK